MAHGTDKRRPEAARGRARRGGSRESLGWKAAALDDIARAGIPVPAAVTLPPGAATMAAVRAAVAQLERAAGRKLGDAANPLLLAVRCAAPSPIPGLMAGVLNVGVNDATLDALGARASSPASSVRPGLAALPGSRRFALDCYRRFLANFGTSVLGIDSDEFDGALAALHHETRTVLDNDLRAADLALLVMRYKRIIRKNTGRDFPADPLEQVRLAVAAAQESWNSPRASIYRRQHNIAGPPAVAVTLQCMVFGNLGQDSAVGRACTRDPSTGESGLRGEFLPEAQGPDLRAAGRTTLSIQRLPDVLPQAWSKLQSLAARLEKHGRAAQEFDFIIERGRVFVLRVRPAHLSPSASVRAAVELAGPRAAEQRAAVASVDAGSLQQLLHPVFDPAADKRLLARGLPASPGAASGQLAFSSAEAEERCRAGERIVLVRRETDPADVAAMHLCAGVLTSSGGMTSHAAVVARGMGVPCVSGATELHIDEGARRLTIAGETFGPADWLSIDGSDGQGYAGQVPTVTAQVGGPLKTLLGWADRYRRLQVRANADTPADARAARELGAQGIGLCRTEHMFFQPGRIGLMRHLILAHDDASRARALEQLLPHQRADFIGMFTEMRGLPVTIRLLDPPLHEFLPSRPADVDKLAADLDVSPRDLTARVERLREANPMLGHRGARLLMTFPEILRMQVRAIIEAAAECRKHGLRVEPEIMLPLICRAREFDVLAAMVRQAADATCQALAVRVPYRVGTMIELPSAALDAGNLARSADFISFGTNDLTQTTFAFSRDDAASFLPQYLERGILEQDPFQTLDRPGVGELIRLAMRQARTARPGISCGICGEHGGDPASIAFCHEVGMDYVSCSPYRVPVARLASAQANIPQPSLR